MAFLNDVILKQLLDVVLNFLVLCGWNSLKWLGNWDIISSWNSVLVSLHVTKLIAFLNENICLL